MTDRPTTRRNRLRQPGIDRREALALGVGVFLAASLPFGRREERRLYRRRVPVMGTIADVSVVHADAARAREALGAALAALRRTEAQMSRFLPESDVGRANREAGRTWVRVQPETAHVLTRALAWARQTQGRFDPCLGRACELWDVKRRSRPPEETRVRALAGRGLWQSLELDVDARGGAVRFRDPDVALDLGGIAKGYGVDAAVRALHEHGIYDGLVNVGGDLYALGVSQDGDAWRIGVRDPDDPGRITRTLSLRNEAVATSGDYEQYFVYGGRRYHHLLDPDTGYPVAGGRHSVTVRAGRCLDADAAATAGFTAV